MFENYNGKSVSNLKLYVRRVMITEEFEDLVPRYLNFIKGVIDSDELPLNVNRESLQQLKMLKVISRKVVRKTLEMLKNLADADGDDEDEDEGEEEEETDDGIKEEEKTDEQKKSELDARRQKRIDRYNEFYAQFGKNIKLGVIEDTANRQKLAKLTRWYSSNNLTELTSLDDYITRCKPGQDNIFYIAGEDKKQLMKSPIIQGLLKKNFEVLLLDDPVDEFTFQHLTEYEKKKLVNVGKGDFKQPEDDELTRQKFKKLKKIFKPLTDWWSKLLSETVDQVQISQRLVHDPIVAISSESGHSANMERISRAQAYSNQAHNAYNIIFYMINSMGLAKKIIEINPNHPAIQELLQKVKEDPDAETEELARVLYEAALVNSGTQSLNNFQVTPSQISINFLNDSTDYSIPHWVSKEMRLLRNIKLNLMMMVHVLLLSVDVDDVKDDVKKDDDKNDVDDDDVQKVFDIDDLIAAPEKFDL